MLAIQSVPSKVPDNTLRAGDNARVVEAADLAFGHSQDLGQDGIGILTKARRRPGRDARKAIAGKR